MTTQKKMHLIQIGFGKMGMAFIKALLFAKKKEFDHVSIVEKDNNRYSKAVEYKQKKRNTDISVHREITPELFAGNPRIYVLIAVKPQNFPEICIPLRRAIETHELTNSVFLMSIMAGVSLKAIAEKTSCRYIARIMPSMSIEVRKTIIGLSFLEYHADTDKEFYEKYEEHKRFIHKWLETCGTVINVSEAQMPAITALSGSGIAFALTFIEALASAGLREGLQYETCLNIASVVTEGAALLLRMAKALPHSLIHSISSPAGTTIEGLYELEQSSFSAAVMNAVRASYNRAIQIEKATEKTASGSTVNVVTKATK